jgi:hypothetical protein
MPNRSIAPVQTPARQENAAIPRLNLLQQDMDHAFKGAPATVLGEDRDQALF